MISEDLEDKIQLTINQNKQPFYVNATAGTTVMGAFDDLNSIADICVKYNLWMHVDVRAFNVISLFPIHFNFQRIRRPVSVEA